MRPMQFYQFLDRDGHETVLFCISGHITHTYYAYVGGELHISRRSR